jgi:hypothetical protein
MSKQSNVDLSQAGAPANSQSSHLPSSTAGTGSVADVTQSGDILPDNADDEVADIVHEVMQGKRPLVSSSSTDAPAPKQRLTMAFLNERIDGFEETLRNSGGLSSTQLSALVEGITNQLLPRFAQAALIPAVTVPAILRLTEKVVVTGDSRIGFSRL